jgi:regulator of ribonuclease activity A
MAMDADGVPATADLCDEHGDSVSVIPVAFELFGRQSSFMGPAATLAVFEDNTLVRAALETPGDGRVLVIDGGMSTRRALVGGNLGQLAVDNGWTGIVVAGAIRDAAEINAQLIGVRAIGTCPRKSEKDDAGRSEVPIVIAGVRIEPGDWIYADLDGVVASTAALHT